MDKKLHQLETIGNYETRQIPWDKSSANWCRMSQPSTVSSADDEISIPIFSSSFHHAYVPRVNH